jgi:3,6-diketocamphane 1,6-monooxygenase
MLVTPTKNLPLPKKMSSISSPIMRLVGERNFKPVSIYSVIDALKRHWEIYSEANIKAGFTPDRQRHAVSPTIFCADTDAEAKRRVREGPVGYCFNRYLLPI